MLTFRIAVIAAVLLAPIGTWAQHGEPLDVAQCFPQMLVDHKIDLSHTSVRYAVLSYWNEDVFHAAQQGGQLSVLLPKVQVPLSLSYNQSDEERVKEIYSNNESLAYDHDTASGSTFLDPQAGQAIRDCLAAKTRRSYGFNYAAYTDTPWRTTLELFWIWTPSETPIQVRTKTISNAVVVDDNRKHPNSLFPGAYLGFSDWGSFAPPTSLVTLERQDANEPIIINLETKPNVGALHIVIPPVSPKEQCTPVQKTEDQFGTKYTAGNQVLADSLPVVSDDGRGHKFFDFSLDISSQPNGHNGIIRSIACRKVGSPQDFMEFTGGVVQGNVAHCYGWWQSTGRSIRIDVDWYKTGYSCTSSPWPVQKPKS